MLRELRNGAIASVLVGVLAGLTGCSDASVLSIPRQSLATVAKLKNKVLSKEEQDSAIRDLSLAQETHQDKALEEIEKR